jgi:pseudouridine-5'-phosphate glycosidase
VAARRGARGSRRASRGGRVEVGVAGRGAAELSEFLKVSPEVARAVDGGRPVVALESSIIGQGLPSPHNLRAARGCEEVIREAGAVPATVAILDGLIKVGLEDEDLQRVASGDAVKVSSRDLGPAIVQRRVGATTVAATVRAAALAGIRFFATGGIGGVHRGHPEDESADLEEISRSPVAVFCAGAKIILDLRLTLERLESLGVPVLGFMTDEFPAFYASGSGCPVSARADDANETALVLRAVWSTGGHGVVVAIPPPYDLDGAEEMARRAARDLGDVSGAAVTPRLLARMAELSGGRSLALNLELVVNNARIAARVAKEYYSSYS